MVLHRYRVQEDRRIRVFLHLLVLADDLVGHGIVGDKAAGPVFVAHFVHAVHLFQADEFVKAQIGVCGVAAPVFAPEAVHRRGLVALGFEVIGQGKHGLCDVLLVGLAAVWQEGDRVARQGLKLHIAGAAAKAGAVGPARSAHLLQCVEVGGNIRVKLVAILLQLGDVPVGFVHHIKDRRLLFCLLRRSRRSVGIWVERLGRVLLPCLHVIQDLVDGLLRVVLRLVNLQIGQVGQKAGDDAVSAVIAVLHPGVGQDAQFLCHRRLQIHAKYQQAARRRTGPKARQPGGPFHLGAAAVQEERTHHHGQDQGDGDRHALLDVDASRRRHARRLRHLSQVPRQKRLPPQLQRVKIHRSGHTAQHCHSQCSQRRKAAQPVQREPDQKQEPPGKGISLPMGPNVLDKRIGVQCAPGDPLRHRQHGQCGQRRKNQAHQCESGCAFRLFGHLVFSHGFFLRLVRAVCRRKPPIVSYYSALLAKIQSSPCKKR